MSDREQGLTRKIIKNTYEEELSSHNKNTGQNTIEIEYNRIQRLTNVSCQK